MNGERVGEDWTLRQGFGWFVRFLIRPAASARPPYLGLEDVFGMVHGVETNQRVGANGRLPLRGPVFRLRLCRPVFQWLERFGSFAMFFRRRVC